MGKQKIFFISLCLAVIAFLTLIVIERKLSNYTPTIKVVYCIKETLKNEELISSNFVLKDIPITEVTNNNITDIAELSKMYAKENIYANEYVKKERIDRIENLNKHILENNEREVALLFSTIDSVVGGTLREGDLVDIVYTNNPSAQVPTRTTEVKLQNIKILGTMDTSGNRIDKNNKNIPANTLILSLTPEQGVMIENCIATGIIKLWKVPEGAKGYEPIRVANGNLTK